MPENPLRRNMLSDTIVDVVLGDLLRFFEEEAKEDIVRKSLEHSKCLVLQFINKFIMEG